VAADGSVSFAGTDTLPEIGPFYFYSAGITDGGIKATIKLGSPQKGRIGFFELGITDIFFAYDSTGITLRAGGYITTQPQDILKLYLYFGYSPKGAEFDYSVTKKDNWVISAGSAN